MTGYLKVQKVAIAMHCNITSRQSFWAVFANFFRASV